MINFLTSMAFMNFSKAEPLLKGEDPDGKGKVDPNACYPRSRVTAMHMAAGNDDVEGVRLLLKYGADKEFKSSDGQTALDIAKQRDAKKVIALLTAE